MLPMAVALALLGGLSNAASTSAAQDLSAPGGDATSAEVAVDGKARAIVAWARWDGASYRIQVGRRSAAGKLGTVKTLSEAGQSANRPRVATDPGGNAIIVWHRPDGANDRVQLRRRSASGKLSPVRTLSPEGQSASDAQVAVDRQGHAYVVWAAWDGANTRVQLVRRSASGKLSPVRTLSAAGHEAFDPEVGVDARGNTYVVWSRWNGVDSRIQLRRRAASGKLGKVQTVSGAGQEAEAPQVAFDPKGHVFLAWQRSDGSSARIQLRRRSAAGSLGPVQTLSAGGGRAPQLTVDAKGRAMVVWSRSTGGNVRTQLRRRSASGSLRPVQTLSAPGGDAENARAAVDVAGRATVLWERWNGTEWRIQATRVPPG